jgi:hypothetical protein
MDTPHEINTLRFCAKRLHELPDPNLSLSELQAVLEWKIIPTSATPVYEYAMDVALFLKYLEEVNLDDADIKTKKLVNTTLKKIGISTAGDDRQGILSAGLAGIVMANLLWYYTSNSWVWMLGNIIPLVVTAVSNSKIMDAQDRTGLSHASNQQEEFGNSMMRTEIYPHC